MSVEWKPAPLVARLAALTVPVALVLLFGVGLAKVLHHWNGGRLDQLLAAIGVVLLLGGLFAWFVVIAIDIALDLPRRHALPAALVALCPGCGTDAGDAAAQCPACALPLAGRAAAWRRDEEERWGSRLLALGMGGGLASLGAGMMVAPFVERMSIAFMIGLVVMGLLFLALGLLIAAFGVSGDGKVRRAGSGWAFVATLDDGRNHYAVDSHARSVGERLLSAEGSGTLRLELSARPPLLVVFELAPPQASFARALAWLVAGGHAILRWRSVTRWTWSDGTPSAPIAVTDSAQQPYRSPTAPRPGRVWELTVEFVDGRDDSVAQAVIAELVPTDGEDGDTVLDRWSSYCEAERRDPSRLLPPDGAAVDGADPQLAKQALAAIATVLGTQTDD